jgi:hypothetical protein
VEMLHPDRLVPETLSQKITQMLFEPVTASDTVWEMLDKDGLPSVSRYVAAEVRARTGS